MIKKIAITVITSLFCFFICASSQALERLDDKNNIKNEANSENSLDPKLKEKAEFSCLKYAGIRLGNEHGIIVTQIKGPSDDNNFWMVVGNKLSNENDERPVSFSCRLIQDDNAFLWPLDDFSLFQITEESVEQMKELQKQQNKDNSKK